MRGGRNLVMFTNKNTDDMPIHPDLYNQSFQDIGVENGARITIVEMKKGMFDDEEGEDELEEGEAEQEEMEDEDEDESKPAENQENGAPKAQEQSDQQPPKVEAAQEFLFDNDKQK